MHPSGIHHVGLTVSDMDRSVRFYRDALGLTLVRRRRTAAAYIGRQTGCPGAEVEVTSFQARAGGGPSLELVQYLSHPRAANEPGTHRPGSAHLCFQVEDVHAAYESLRRQGVCFKTPPVEITSGPNQGGFGVYLSDPDGFTLELFQPPRDAARRASGAEGAAAEEDGRDRHE
jgi:catechol 2,3-dioxygenase-like lactoylglutathione lyase family enzyme